MYAPRRLAVLTLAVSAAVVLTFGAGSGRASRASAGSVPELSGTWLGKYSGGYNGTFTLHWTLKGSRLTGTIKLSNPRGTFTVSGSVHGSTISFGALTAGATYTGKLSGNSMSGTYKTVPKGGSWSAKKVVRRG